MKTFSHLLVSGILLLAQPSFGQNTIVTTSSPLAGGGQENVLIGPGNPYSASFSGGNNVAVGMRTAVSNTTGHDNSFFGYYAGANNTVGQNNSFLGSLAGRSNNSGDDNVFVGNSSGRFNSTGSYNSFIGFQAGLNNTTGLENTFFGYQAGYSNSMGVFNSFTGGQAGYSNTTGNGNLFTGREAGYGNITGSYNSFTGFRAGYGNKTGSYNSFTGNGTGFFNTTGSYNSFTGYLAGNYITAGSYNSFYGSYAGSVGPNKEYLQRATALGYGALVGVNDGLVLGDGNIKVGIGTAYPDQRLTIQGNINFVAYDNSLRLKNQPFLHFNEHESLALGLGAELAPGAARTLVLGSGTTHVEVPGKADVYTLTLTEFAGHITAGQFLTVDQSGRVVLAQPHVQVATTADWADKVFAPGYALRPLGEVEQFVRENGHLPGVPSAAAMVAEGVNVTTIITKQMEKIEELTLYVLELKKENDFQRKKNDGLETRLIRLEKQRTTQDNFQK